MSDWLHGVRVPPLRTSDLRQFAKAIRLGAKIEVAQPFPVLPFLEHAMPAALIGFDFEVTDNLSDGNEACAYPDGCRENPSGPFIKLSTTVYTGAHKGNGRHRLTVLHEIAHVILHRQVAVHPRGPRGSTLRAYENSEWQANQFAAELLMPPECFLPNEDLDAFCVRLGVSKRAAQLRAKKLTDSGAIPTRNNWPEFLSQQTTRRCAMPIHK